MRRTQIYLTEEQDQLVGTRARELGVSKAAVIRQLLDERLGIDEGGEREAAILQTSGLLADYPDWPEWLASVRGPSADEKLHRLGL
ncbi:MAG TPA: CopG family transcriptional regulator [Actinomycetota bacterium]|nr:CopG family transcriptional regulator [Actinomycetota bacterium]